jgi:hypothetical protein
MSESEPIVFISHHRIKPGRAAKGHWARRSLAHAQIHWGFSIRL